jgi:hypothetical protein
MRLGGVNELCLRHDMKEKGFLYLSFLGKEKEEKI